MHDLFPVGAFVATCYGVNGRVVSVTMMTAVYVVRLADGRTLHFTHDQLQRLEDDLYVPIA